MDVDKKAAVSSDVLTQVLCQEYGLEMTSCSELSSYYDHVFRIETKIGTSNPHISHAWRHGYIFKIMNPSDSKNTARIDMEHKMLLCAADSGVGVPKLVPTRSGQLYTKIYLKQDTSECLDTSVVRLFEFIPGETLTGVTLTKDLCFMTGALAAKLDKSLQEVTSCLQGRQDMEAPNLWDLRRIADAFDLYGDELDDSLKQLAGEVVKEFETRILCNLHRYPDKLLHHDFNDDNILVRRCGNVGLKSEKYDVAAILDFSDFVFGPYIFEIAIVMAYISQISDSLSPELVSGWALAGYLTEISLSREEIRMLRWVICGRLVISLLHGAVNIRLHPHNKYLVKSRASGIRILRHFWQCDSKKLFRIWDEICTAARENMNIIKT